MKLIFVLLLSMASVACNYHLRGGGGEVPDVMRHIYLQAASQPLYNSFQDTLRMAGGALIEKPSPNGFTVNILKENFDRRSLSLSATGKTNEFQLFYILEFEVLGPNNKVVMPRQRIEVTRDYFNNQQDIIGKNNEEDLIRADMYKQAVRLMMDRGRALLQKGAKK